MKARLWQEWMIVFASVWLFAAPVAFGYAKINHPGAMLAWLSAVALFISATEALVLPEVFEEWIDTFVAVGLLAGPWALGFAADRFATYNSVGIGLVVLFCAVAALIRDVRLHREQPHVNDEALIH